MSQKHDKKDLSSEEDEEDSNDFIQIEVGTTTIKIHYYLLCKYSKIPQKYTIDDVQNNLPNDLQNFQRKTNISNEVIILYFQNLKEEQFAINNDNFSDFYKISEFLGNAKLLTKLKKYQKNNLDDIDYIIHLLIDSNSSTEEDYSSNLIMEEEKKLSKHINECFQNSNFAKLPITTIHRILSYDKSKINNDQLYNFIQDGISDRFTLFAFLNPSQLSDENLEKLLKKYEESLNKSEEKYYQYINMSFIFKKLKNDLTNKTIECSQLKKENENLKKKLDVLLIQNDEFCDGMDSLLGHEKEKKHE